MDGLWKGLLRNINLQARSAKQNKIVQKEMTILIKEGVQTH